ncbi:MAG: ABC transporter permease, partial [Deltaproteobacteria bacterium]|nr:ABC transporter permease [Deltaproteobacteria bacterium]
MTLSTLLRFNLRYYRRHRLLSVLCLLGISLGVGILVAVQLINDCALASFSSSVDFLSGAATHSIVSGYGRIEEGGFLKVWEHPKVKAASPVIEAMAETLETGGEPIRFVGIDPFLDAPFRTLMPRERTQGQLVEFLASEVPVAYLSSALMTRFGLKPGDSLTILTAGIHYKVTILGSIAPSGIREADNLAVMDISAAQDFFGRAGYLDRIDIIAGSDTEGLLEVLPHGLTITDANEQKSALKAMLYSFQLNLAAMSLLALFVGIFLIYNFAMFSVLSRRQDMSLMLTLGSDHRDLVAAFIGESILLGSAGSVLGIAFGFMVAWLSMDRVSSTISELYFHLNPGTVHLTAPIAAAGFAVGFVATLVGSGLPALEVAVTPPVLGMKRQSIEERARSLEGLLLGGGFIFCVVSILCAWGSRFSIFWGFASAFAMTLAFAFFTPSVLSRLTDRPAMWLRKLSGSLELFLAARTIRASLSRTSIAVAALAVALSMTLGVDTMIYSFRRSVDLWLYGALQGDIYISPGTVKWDHPLPDSLVRAVIEDPRIDAVERYSTYPVSVNGKPAKLRVVDAAVLKDRSRFTFLKGAESAWDKMQQGGVFVSESFSYRFRVDPGKTVELDTPDGKRSFPIVAVLRDYSSDQGTIHIDRALYEKIWNDRRVHSV